MKIVDICHYYTFPPKAGGQIRIYNINRELSKKHIVEQFSFTPALRKKTSLKINNHYHEHIFPVLSYQASAFFLYRLFHIPYDFPIPFLFRFCPMPDPLKHKISNSDVIIVEHPWLFSWTHRLAKDIILVSHNVEYDLQKEGIKHLPNWVQDRINKFVYDTEEYATQKAKHIFAVSEEDKKRLCELYGVSPQIVSVVPNGVDCEKFQSNMQKVPIKKSILDKFERKVLFAGAGHPPNEQAVDIIENNIAPKLPKLLFIVAGSVTKKKGLKKNIYYTGPVKEILPYFQISDIAINPMVSGSGTNIKVLEYMAAGLPVVTTKLGARGFDLKNDVIFSSIDKFPVNIQKVFKPKLFNSLRTRGRRLAKKFDWSIICKDMIQQLENEIFKV